MYTHIRTTQSNRLLSPATEFNQLGLGWNPRIWIYDKVPADADDTRPIFRELVVYVDWAIHQEMFVFTL